MKDDDSENVGVCRCGHGRGHYMVSEEPEYGAWGWFSMLLGISATPTKVRFRCRRCDTLVP
jgi:hypothetical protein